MIRPILIAGFGLAILSACAPSIDQRPVYATSQAGDALLRRQIAAVLTEHGVHTAAIGVLRDGKLVFEHYHGDAGGAPANAETRFDVASITKTVAAETLLRMVADGKIDLDEPLYRYWIDPDIAGDARHRLLTPRLILTHRSGFPNWRFLRPGGKLAFERDPGSGYGYSGEGFNYLWRAIERKQGASFPALADRYLFKPLGIRNARLTVDHADQQNVALGIDEKGKRYDPGCRPGFCWKDGEWSAAGGMLITLRDYARILSAVGDHTGYGTQLALERDRIVTDRGDESVVDCSLSLTTCPEAEGYGLGFVVVDQGKRRAIGHEGGDWSQLTLAYMHLPSRDGIVIFLNVPMVRGVTPMRDLVRLLDPTSPYVSRFEKWASEARGRPTIIH